MREIETRTLPCVLTPEELAKRADELSITLGTLERVEQDKHEAQARFKVALELLDAGIRRLGKIVRERKEDRPIDCRIIYDDAKLQVETVRDDTGEVVDIRAMTTDEEKEAKQQTLPGMAKHRRRTKAKLIPIDDADKPDKS